MSRALITESYLTGIANAIRAKLGVQDMYRPPQMASAIESIPTGGIVPEGTINIAQNGTFDVTQYASANVNVQPNLQSKTATENGTVTPDQGYDGLSSVVVNVSGGGGNNFFKRLIPVHTDLVGGYITGAQWIYGDLTSRTDVYALEHNKYYIIMLGANVGNRFRTAFFQSDPADATSIMNGTSLRSFDAPYAYMVALTQNNTLFMPDRNGYLGIGKTNQNVDGIESYVFEVVF